MLSIILSKFFEVSILCIISDMQSIKQRMSIIMISYKIGRDNSSNQISVPVVRKYFQKI